MSGNSNRRAEQMQATESLRRQERLKAEAAAMKAEAERMKAEAGAAPAETAPVEEAPTTEEKE